MRTALFVLSTLAFVGCTRTEPAPGTSPSASASAQDKTSISVKGSDTMVILGQRWAETYMKDNPGVTIQVTGGGSGTGIAALINATTDICESSRPMKDKERADVKAKRGVEAVETKVALDALAVYVSQKNDLDEMSVPTLARIYKGEAKTWKDVGGKSAKPIVLYGRENNSGTYGFFKEHVLENKDFAPNVQTLAGTAAVVAAVKGDDSGIGYGGIAYSEGVKLLKLKKTEADPAIAASYDTAQNGSYPLSRFLFFYTAGEPTGSVKKFIDWVLSDSGQKVIEEVGYYRLPAK
jgi:phosphate transport system substrate-binding protein